METINRDIEAKFIEKIKQHDWYKFLNKTFGIELQHDDSFYLLTDNGYGVEFKSSELNFTNLFISTKSYNHNDYYDWVIVELLRKLTIKTLGFSPSQIKTIKILIKN